MRKTPPYRLQTPRLVLRCYSPADAPLLAEAVQESVAHLLPFMEWAAAEPEPLEVKVERLRRFRRQFDADQDYVYGIFDLSESRLLGGTGLHTRASGNALEIGYWVRVSALRQGVAAEAAAALTRVGFDFCGVERMEIHCSAHNLPSAGVARKLGYIHEATRRRLGFFNGQADDSMIWTMFAAEYALSPCIQAAFRAWDAAGQEISLP